MIWAPWTQGVEQTAIITMVSPTGGAPLISGFGDLGGFVHRRLDRSPETIFRNPGHANTNSLDYAGKRPGILVRAGNLHSGSLSVAGLAWSADGGMNWLSLRTPDWSSNASREHDGAAPISVSADGKYFYVGAERAWLSADRGASWQRIFGLDGGLRIVADKVDGRLAWAIDHRAGNLLRSIDGGRHFSPVAAKGGCADLRVTAPHNRETPGALLVSPYRAGELYLLCGGRLYRSRDGGANFSRIGNLENVELFSVGKGQYDGEAAIYVKTRSGADFRLLRSLNEGRDWVRIDDPAHRWGNRIRTITADTRHLGRIYIGTDGRGIIYGDPE
jgi:photosystem II stability/assembly factor-like uncharacterized protein